VFGDFTNCDEPNKDNFIEEVLARFCAELKIPALKGIENGHGDLQRPLFFNTRSEINCKEGELKVYSPFQGKVK
jgi:muramoyltetrapeptide carboxypeptidase LdcA involved in peptidoglycan recycling